MNDTMILTTECDFALTLNSTKDGRQVAVVHDLRKGNGLGADVMARSIPRTDFYEKDDVDEWLEAVGFGEYRMDESSWHEYGERQHFFELVKAG